MHGAIRRSTDATISPRGDRSQAVRRARFLAAPSVHGGQAVFGTRRTLGFRMHEHASVGTGVLPV